MNNYIKKGVKLIISLSIAFLVCIVILFDLTRLTENGFINTYYEYGIDALKYSVLFCVGSFILLSILFGLVFFNRVRLLKGLVIIAVAFGVCETVCLYMYYFDSIFDILINEKFWLYTICSIISYGSIFYSVGIVFLRLIEKIKLTKRKISKYGQIWDKYIGIISFLFIMLGWLPWILIFYPGSMWYDMCYQLEQYYGYADYNLHPVFVTLIMGKCLDIGKIIFNSDNAGVFLYILLQTNVCCFVYSCVIVWINKKQLPYIVEIAAMCFYAFFPVFGSVAQYGVKDVMTYGLFTLFLLQSIKIFENYRLSQGGICKDNLSFFFCAVLCSLYRKEMIIICCCVFIAFGIYGFYLKEIRKMACYIILIMLLCISYKGFDTIVVNRYLGSDPGGGYNSTEALSIPLQQIARFVYFHSDLISDEEKTVLEACYSMGYDEIANNYNPYLSDPIKYNFNTNVNGFWDMYVSLFFKSPTTYIESMIANSFGYYAIIPPLPATIHNAPTNGTPGDRYLYYINRDPDLNNNIVNISYSSGTSLYREKLVKYVYDWRDIPLLCLFYTFGTYTWFLIFLIYCNLRTKKTIANILVFIPTILVIMVCVASPVNDCLRYYVSVIASIPCLVVWTSYFQKT